MQSIDDYDDYLSAHGDPFEDCQELEYGPEEERILIDLDDFIALAQSDSKGKATINYILRALRLGVEPSVILALFDEDTGASIDGLLTKPDSPFYIPGNEEEYEK